MYIAPILASSVDYEGLLSGLKILSTNEKAINEWSDREKAYQGVRHSSPLAEFVMIPIMAGKDRPMTTGESMRLIWRNIMFTRRQFFRISLAAGASFFVLEEYTSQVLAPTVRPAPTPIVRPAHTPIVRPAPTLTVRFPLKRFVDPLPLPRVLQPGGSVRGTPWYLVTMTEFQQKLHRDLPPTTVWGYNGTYPGPTIEARSNKPILVKWVDSLPHRHLFPVDRTLMDMTLPDVRNVVHLHGGHTPPDSDGNPTQWFTPGHSKTCFYPNLQQAATLWYHDHAMSITRLNNYAGLAGFYLIRDATEDHLNLPKGVYEIPLLIQDRSFQLNGQLFYPGPDWVPMFFGNTAMVNGKAWPFLEVQPRKYRFRLLNGSNSRIYKLALSSGQPFYQIGTDGGLLPAPVQLTQIILAPAERADIIINFSGHHGQHITLTNSAPADVITLSDRQEQPLLLANDAFIPLDGGQIPLTEIMQFRVVLPLLQADTSSLPLTARPLLSIPHTTTVKRERDLTLEVRPAPEGFKWLLNGQPFSAPITEKPKLGTTEIWRLINLTGMTHPIHLHLIQFQILDRQPFDMNTYKATKTLIFTGSPIPPPLNEAGPKDTVRANPGEVTRIMIHFGPYTGQYIWHCHLLEHEDNDMMRPYEVVP